MKNMNKDGVFFKLLIHGISLLGEANSVYVKHLMNTWCCNINTTFLKLPYFSLLSLWEINLMKQIKVLQLISPEWKQYVLLFSVQEKLALTRVATTGKLIL